MDGVLQRIYISVLAEFDADGKITPRRLELPDGRRYDINRLVRTERRASSSGGGQTLRYEVLIHGQTRYLFQDINTNQWFVEVAAP